MSESVIERVGVWLEDSYGAESDDAAPSVFRGEVWEREMGQGPPEWSRLSANAPLPIELLNGQSSFECTVNRPEAYPILGPVVDLQRVLWVPISRRGVLRGLILLGSRRSNIALPRLHAENVAAELSALLELEEQRRLAQLRKADLELCSHVRVWQRGKQNGGMMLAQLAESCTRGVANGGVGAAFAVIGERQDAMQRGPSWAEGLNIRAQSGNPESMHHIHEMLRSLAKQVLETDQSHSLDTNELAFKKENTRIAALPINCGGRAGGVLLVGLPKAKAHLGSYSQLEVRADLAGDVLEREIPRQARG